MPEDPNVLDRVYRALAHPARRDVLRALRDGEARISDLAEPLPLSFAEVARHVAALEAAGLIERDVRGRDHWLALRRNGLRDAEAWINEQSAAWAERADALAAHLRKARKGA